MVREDLAEIDSLHIDHFRATLMSSRFHKTIAKKDPLNRRYCSHLLYGMFATKKKFMTGQVKTWGHRSP